MMRQGDKMKIGKQCLTLLILMVAVTGTQSQDAGDVEGERWAVVVAGSSNWWNYGDQACVCHSYHLLLETGIPDDHIIVMMYDDIAYNEDNPNPGVIINEPNGPNVYEGVIKDYVDKDVTPGNFLKVLSGDEEGLHGVGTGKVVNSGPNDRIFVYFNDHGAPGLFCFPDDNLYATDFADVVLDMHANNKFKEMMVYMDSCYSGSMFQDLYPDDIGFYAVSSANEEESAYNCCYNETLDAYIAAEFSLAWMKTTEWSGVTNQTIGDQYNSAVGLVESSHVMKYGQMDIQKELLSVFLGPGPQVRSPNPFPGICPDTAAKSDLYYSTLKQHLEQAKDDEEKDSIIKQINVLLENRRFVTEITKKIVLKVTNNAELTHNIMEIKESKMTDRTCHETAVKSFTKNCFNLGKNNFALQMLPMLQNLCDSGYTATMITDATENVCVFPKTTGIH